MFMKKTVELAFGLYIYHTSKIPSHGPPCSCLLLHPRNIHPPCLRLGGRWGTSAASLNLFRERLPSSLNQSPGALLGCLGSAFGKIVTNVLYDDGWVTR